MDDTVHQYNRLCVSTWLSERSALLSATKTFYVTPAVLDFLGIESEQLFLRSDGSHNAGQHFFKPHSVDWVAWHPPDLSDEDDRDEVDQLEKFWLLHDRELNDDQHGAEAIATCLASEFLTLLRLPAGSGALQDLSGWTEGQ
jgi:hypothetical protein